MSESVATLVLTKSVIVETMSVSEWHHCQERCLLGRHGNCHESISAWKDIALFVNLGIQSQWDLNTGSEEGQRTTRETIWIIRPLCHSSMRLGRSRVERSRDRSGRHHPRKQIRAHTMTMTCSEVCRRPTNSLGRSSTHILYSSHLATGNP